MASFAERLRAAILRTQTPLCVGLDPRWEQLPEVIRAPFGGKVPDSLESVAAAYQAFCLKILDLVAPHVGIVKIQAAFFEQCGAHGFLAMERIMARAKDRGLFLILDGKRNDIASTAVAYAEAAFGGPTFGGKSFPVWNADAITVNPYLGTDGLAPFVQAARKVDGGIFVLARTSNPGAGLFQDLQCPDEKLYRKVAKTIDAMSEEKSGKEGWGDVGAVVGATYPAEIAELREVLRHSWMLIPGYGAQGAGAKELAGAFTEDGLGAVINNGRAILFAAPPREPAWEEAVTKACLESKKALASVCQLK